MADNDTYMMDVFSMTKVIDGVANDQINDYVKKHIFEDFLAEPHDDDISFNIGVYQGLVLASDFINYEARNRILNAKREAEDSNLTKKLAERLDEFLKERLNAKV